MQSGALEPDGLARRVIGACIEVHRRIGPGLLESVYEECLCQELRFRGIAFERQKPIPVRYRNIVLECAYRADLVVGGSILVEIKAVERLADVCQAQVLTYLRLLGLRRGLLVNFCVPVLWRGVSTLINPQLRARMDNK